MLDGKSKKNAVTKNQKMLDEKSENAKQIILK